ncbi:D-alanyl-D-alanine carboxypeptidase/D-alanyl-D-alanine-endopeptidase [Aliiroseovarius sp. S1339]|uniref:D-alanyl-D-alanine carboxypeptidase/D-alanyl-D-alanine endopeptidase n=1 Tax=Aliiroseovarius sp. S1339 TaxID=2936990 RepID=UPI0020BF9C3D|nr:D-alanyl-D-alanine carboxypeptidase/D-alanyl-D-alanine-endopeptidase [Aliiroseovarius sp. S1339]MCK8462742.1 D-alanyl-D-alanine carboxypeptidase/D-alanyl-D-alanine-endopeptidase [Aliiroseovarius sp. S1339]
MAKVISRRAILGGLGASLAGPVFANAPERSIRPAPKILDFSKRTIPTAEALMADANLGGKIGFVVADSKTGLILEANSPVLPLPPASVAKAITAVYGISSLGLEHSFATEVIATGPIEAGVVQGDLVLVGGGDPTLDTNALAGLAKALKAKGIIAVKGDFVVYGGQLPYQRMIDPGQPDHLGYNPAVSGLNLNYNRVHFEWKRAGKDFDVALDARSGQFRPVVKMAKMQIVDRRGPVYTYDDAMGVDNWTVARGALGKGGSRWLPVRRPDLYAGEVFQVLARGEGIRLPGPVVSTTPPKGTVLAAHRSRALMDMTRGMLKYSTNLTAEVIGLSASTARGEAPTSLATSGAAMGDWMNTELGARRAQFQDHSGLSDRSRISAHDMVKALVSVGPNGYLQGLMKEVRPLDRKGRPVNDAAYSIRAKTGTLNFVSSLAGYLTAPDGTPLTFAIFTADLDRRAAIPKAERERPKGAKGWSRQSRWLQQQLLSRWALTYGT